MFEIAKTKCFPPLSEGTDWAKRRVTVVTYAVDIRGQEKIPDGLSTEDFVLAGFEGRVEIKKVIEGKGKNKTEFSALIITGEWLEEDRQALLSNNPEKIEGENGDEIENPAHAIVKKALNKWNDNWKKAHRKSSGAEEGVDQE
jgi:hypothetical protein